MTPYIGIQNRAWQTRAARELSLSETALPQNLSDQRCSRHTKMLAKSITARLRIRYQAFSLRSFGSCSFVGNDNDVPVSDAARGDRLIADQELLEGPLLVGSGDEPDDAAGVVDGGIGEG